MRTTLIASQMINIAAVAMQSGTDVEFSGLHNDVLYFWKGDEVATLMLNDFDEKSTTELAMNILTQLEMSSL